jgi:hypothetical protein
MTCKSLLLTILMTFSAISYPAQEQSSKAGDPWAPFQFIVGDWAGAGSGQPGEAVLGSTSFSFDLGKTILVRRNRAQFAPGPGEKSGALHEDLLIIYRETDEPKFRAVFFDNEGHVIYYRVSLPANQPSVVFESDASDRAPRFRLVYEMGSDGLLSVKFMVAPPGGEFKTYTKGIIKRVS